MLQTVRPFLPSFIFTRFPIVDMLYGIRYRDCFLSRALPGGKAGQSVLLHLHSTEQDQDQDHRLLRGLVQVFRRMETCGLSSHLS